MTKFMHLEGSWAAKDRKNSTYLNHPQCMAVRYDEFIHQKDHKIINMDHKGNQTTTGLINNRIIKQWYIKSST